jgi:ABC-type taurine transport system substrate-binding protein
LEFEQKMAQANETANVLNNLASLVGKQTAAGKALGIATALINTYVGVSEALKQKSTLPSPYDYVAKAVNVASILATGFKSVKAITAVKVPGGGGGGVGATPSMSAASGGGTPAAPNFNVVGNSGVNQIAQTLGSQQPIQTYVVANQVTTQQALDRSIVQNASMG